MPLLTAYALTPRSRAAAQCMEFSANSSFSTAVRAAGRPAKAGPIDEFGPYSEGHF